MLNKAKQLVLYPFFGNGLTKLHENAVACAITRHTTSCSLKDFTCREKMP
jgi:hypothetical protein